MTDATTHCNYLRVRDRRRIPLSETVDVPGRLLFIDDAAADFAGWGGNVAEQLRFIDETALIGLAHVLIRTADTEDAGSPLDATPIADVIEQRGRTRPPIGVFSIEPGDSHPNMSWLLGQPSQTDSELLATARAVELAALLQAGKAHWRPTTFHYELPSEEHRADFIRIGDALRSPRDAAALATWLYPFVAHGQSLLLDTSSLLPLAMALEHAMKRRGLTLGPVVTRDAYPHSPLIDEELVELAVGFGGAIALLSVSSTGETARRLGRCLERKTPGEWVLQTIVDRAAPTSLHWPGMETAHSSPWLHVPKDAKFGKQYDKQECDLCDDRDRAPFVRIDASSFANTSLPEPPEVAMPDPPNPARDFANLLEMYDDVDGMAIDCEPSERTRIRRSERRLGVRFYPRLLLNHERFIHALNHQTQVPLGDSNDGRCDLGKLRGIDAIVALREDAETKGFNRLAKWASERFADGPIDVTELASRPNDSEPSMLFDALGKKRHILVLTVGTVTGGTLQELLVRIHRALSERPKDSYQISGLVVHARPSTFRDWQSIRSAYSQRLVAMWMTYLPARDHPLAGEQRLLRPSLDDDQLPDDVREAVVSFANGRQRQVLNSPHSDWHVRTKAWRDAGREARLDDPRDSNPAAVLLCARPDRTRAELPRLLPNSRFGHRMSMIGTLVGVGAVMHRQRLERDRRGGPPGIRFDLTRIPSVYFEVPILCAVLRWIRPAEAFWDYRGKPIRDVLLDMWHKAQFEEAGSRETLVAELALAAAAGKIPPTAKATLHELIARLPDDDSVDQRPLRLAQQLLHAAWGPPDAGTSSDSGG